MTDKTMLTVEEIERLRTDISHTMTNEEWFALCDMALAHRRAVEGEKPVAWRERIEQFDACIRAVAAELGACCGGVDGDQSDPHSTTAVLLAKIRERHAQGVAQAEPWEVNRAQAIAMSQQPGSPWQPINTATESDNLIWLRRGSAIEGPRQYEADDDGRWDLWAHCEAPPLTALPSYAQGSAINQALSESSPGMVSVPREIAKALVYAWEKLDASERSEG